MENVETNSAGTLALMLLLGSLMALGGCRICADCEDLAYPAYGGSWQRTLRDSGRVGSVFDPGGARASELVSRDAPPEANDLERQRQEDRGSKTKSPDRDGEESDEMKEKEFEDREQMEDELREKRLDDIEQEREDEMRRKNLDDINVRIIPGQPVPPILQ